MNKKYKEIVKRHGYIAKCLVICTFVCILSANQQSNNKCNAQSLLCNADNICDYTSIYSVLIYIKLFVFLLCRGGLNDSPFYYYVLYIIWCYLINFK